MTVETLSRAVDAYRRTATSRSALLLVVANLIPLVGVLFFGWSLWTILALYWVENGIVGFWNVPKLLLAQGASAAESALGRVRVFGSPVGGGAGRVGLAIFFVMHYGIFWFVHGAFVFMLPTFFGGGSALGCDLGTISPGALPGDLPDTAAFANACGSLGGVVWSNVVIAAVAMFISHGASFLLNYLGRGEYLTTSPMRQMGAPYGRVVVLHVTILFGAFAIALFGAPIGALLILIVLKTAFDLGLHLRERSTAAARLGTSPGAAAEVG